MSDQLEFGGATWTSLVAETQFATELVLTGLRRLCSVPTDPDVLEWTGNDLNYALHVGLYAYSSGLERLCKLAIACNGYVANGEFPELRRYSHRIGKLLDDVEGLTPIGPGASVRKEKYFDRPVDPLDPDLTDTVEQFASGAGRYEHLDSLWNNKAQVTTYKDWCALAARASVSKEVHDLIGLREAMTYAIRSELADDGLESTAQPVVEDLERRKYEPSVGVALSLFRKVRWVSAILDNATDYTGKGLPLLGEVVNTTFVHSSVDFFKYDIAGISDQDVVEEELQEVCPRIQEREAEEDDEDFEEDGTEG
jgi:hypothetical protein